MRTIVQAKPDSELLEKELESIVIGTKTNPGWARTTGWLAYHTLRSKGSEAGYPDWTLVRDRVVFVGSKREQGVVSDAQRKWIRALHDAGAEVYIVRPRNILAIAAVLGARRTDTAPYFTSHAAAIARGELLEQLGKELQ